MGIIVIGADTHKDAHTFAAVRGGTSEVVSDRTVAADAGGFGAALAWWRGLGGDRVWAIEDCRHVSGRLERFLVARGERIVRVVPKVMAGARQGARERGKSDRIDAIAVARAALREGIETLPAAYLDERALEIRRSSTTASGSSPRAPGCRTTCAGTCTTCGPSCGSRPVAWTAPSGWTSSPAAWPAPSTPPASASRATSCAASAT